MYGLPGQTLDAWRQTLEKALSFAPEHLSCYQLTLAAGETPAIRAADGPAAARGELTLRMKKPSGNFSSSPPTSSRRGAISTTKWPISPGKKNMCCRHNLKYWTRTPYLGLGPAAHSFQAGRRWWNFSSVAEYCAVLERRRGPGGGDRNPHPGANPPGDPLPGVPDP